MAVGSKSAGTVNRRGAQNVSLLQRLRSLIVAVFTVFMVVAAVLVCLVLYQRINANTLNNEGLAKSEAGDHSGAIEVYDRVLRTNPDNADALYNGGIAKFYLGDYSGAIEVYDRVLRINPDDVFARFNIEHAKEKL